MINKKKTIILSGSSKGVGFEIAKLFNKNRFNLILIARNFEKEFLKKFNYMDNVFLISSAIEDKLVTKKINQILKENKLLSPSIIINNSGGPDPIPPLNLDEEKLDSYLNSGLKGFIRIIKEYSPNMIENKWGRILNIGSTVSKEPSAIMATSATVRAALNAYSKALSLDLAPHGITVNTINLGGVFTDRIQTLFKKIADAEKVSTTKKIKEAEASIPMKRFAKPIEVAHLIGFLCSRKADYITGQIISIDGGLSKSI